MAKLRVSALVVLATVVGCGDDGEPLIPDGTPSDSFVAPPYWQPTPGEAADWDIQLVAPFDVSTPRQMYILDLWDVATGGSIEYDDGTSLAITPGPLAGSVADITGTGTLVCQITVGAIKLGDPDRMRFPGFEATPPDREDPPAAGSVIGWSVIGDPNTRYLDIRAAARAMWLPTMFKRFEYAKSIGCDAVDAIWIDRNENDTGMTTGFPAVGTDMTGLYTDVVADLHTKELSAGFHVNTTVGKALTSGFAESYDFLVVERCAEFEADFQECDQVKSFDQANKATFAFDFDDDGVTDRDGDKLSDGISFSGGCLQVADLAYDWIHKDTDAAFRPSSAYRMAKSECE